MSVIEMAMQNGGDNILCSLWALPRRKGRGRCGTHLPTEIVVRATHREFDKNDSFFTTFCDLYIIHISRCFSYTFHLQKGYKGLFFKKNA
jgi:hypothetical protein